jgi:hypothetical protein
MVANAPESYDMDAEQYLDEFVDPTIAEYADNPTSRRRAFLACAALFHTIDYMQFPEKDGNLRKILREASIDFALVDRIAHAFKHASSGHARDPINQPLKADDVISRPPAIFGTMILDLSRWDDEAGGVTLDADREIDLLVTLKRAAAFMRAQIKPEL